MDSILQPERLVAPCLELHGDAVDASDGRDDPEGIADADATVLPHIDVHGGYVALPSELVSLGFPHELLCRGLVVGICRAFGKERGDIERVDMLSLRYVLIRRSDRVAVLDDLLTLLYIAESDLMALRDIREGRERIP